MYEEYLRALLAPLGVYRLDRDSLSGAELYALGQGLDAVSARLDGVEREGVTATAEDEGLRRREALFLRRPAAVTCAPRAWRGRMTALCSKPETTTASPGPTKDLMAIFSAWVAFRVNATCSGSASKSRPASSRQR